jgi:hypothetical protein
MRGIEVIFLHCCFWSLNASRSYIVGHCGTEGGGACSWASLSVRAKAPDDLSTCLSCFDAFRMLCWLMGSAHNLRTPETDGVRS